MIVCLDTSGSMRGAPETIAKAVVLQAVRTAHAERRGCLLISFGGPDEIVERDLAGGRARQGQAEQGGHGLAGLLDLMGQGFDGGTDLQAPIARAIDRVHQARWASADLLIVSDGEFGCTRPMLDALDAARDQLGLRVQGVLVGDRETMGLLEVCDHIHWVRDWRRHAGDGKDVRPSAFSPVHSQSLTALYFPNALSGRAARHRPGRVGRPLAPRAGVERRTRQPGVFHRQQVVAGRDARAAAGPHDQHHALADPAGGGALHDHCSSHGLHASECGYGL